MSGASLIRFLTRTIGQRPGSEERTRLKSPLLYSAALSLRESEKPLPYTSALSPQPQNMKGEDGEGILPGAECSRRKAEGWILSPDKSGDARRRLKIMFIGRKYQVFGKQSILLPRDTSDWFHGVALDGGKVKNRVRPPNLTLRAARQIFEPLFPQGGARTEQGPRGEEYELEVVPNRTMLGPQSSSSPLKGAITYHETISYPRQLYQEHLPRPGKSTKRSRLSQESSLKSLLSFSQDKALNAARQSPRPHNTHLTNENIEN